METLETTTDQKRVQALVQFFGCKADEVNETHADSTTFEVDSEPGEYMVLTDDEADEYAKEYIEQSLWAFNADFIIDHSPLEHSEGSQKVISAIQEQCEDGNEAVLALIYDLDEFVEDAISADGRGHFMSSYDGVEEEETVEDDDGKTDFFIYRQN